MNRNRLKHEVLGILIDTYHKEWDYAPYHGAEYYFKIEEKLKGDSERILGACFALVANGDATTSEDEEYNTMFTVTDRGRYSRYENIYLNRIWWRSQKFWSIFVPTLISLGALAVSIFALYD